MKNLIKKILKEEIDSDWDFVTDLDEFEYFTPKMGEVYIWKDYNHGSDEIIILNVGRGDIEFESMIPLPNDDRSDSTWIDQFRQGLKDGWITPIVDTLKEETDSDWGWVDDIPYFRNTPISIIFNQNPTEEEYMRLAKMLDDGGFTWVNSGKSPTEWSPIRYWGNKDGGVIYLTGDNTLLQSPKNSGNYRHRIDTSNEVINYKDLFNEKPN